MKPAELDRYLGPPLSNAGFTLDEVQEAVAYGDRPAWAVYYRNSACKLQICWSARDGGIDFMLAPLEASNEFGLVNRSKKWHFMLMLSEVHDDLKTPGLDADDEAVMSWRKALVDTRFDAACAALLSKGKTWRVALLYPSEFHCLTWLLRIRRTPDPLGWRLPSSFCRRRTACQS